MFLVLMSWLGELFYLNMMARNPLVCYCVIRRLTNLDLCVALFLFSVDVSVCLSYTIAYLSTTSGTSACTCIYTNWTVLLNVNLLFFYSCCVRLSEFLYSDRLSIATVHLWLAKKQYHLLILHCYMFVSYFHTLFVLFYFLWHFFKASCKQFWCNCVAQPNTFFNWYQFLYEV